MEPSERTHQRIDADLARITAVARRVLKHEYGTGNELPDDFRLDTFVIVPVFAWSENDGDLPVDMTTIGSESRRLYIQRGALECALDILKGE